MQSSGKESKTKYQLNIKNTTLTAGVCGGGGRQRHRERKNIKNINLRHARFHRPFRLICRCQVKDNNNKGKDRNNIFI